jgi:hypothetical protein
MVENGRKRRNREKKGTGKNWEKRKGEKKQGKELIANPCRSVLINNKVIRDSTCSIKGQPQSLK